MPIEFSTLTWLSVKPEMPRRECIILRAVKVESPSRWRIVAYCLKEFRLDGYTTFRLYDENDDTWSWDWLWGDKFAIIEGLPE